MTAAGWLPVMALCLEAGGLRERLVVVDEERVLSLLVSPVLEEPVTICNGGKGNHFFHRKFIESNLRFWRDMLTCNFKCNLLNQDLHG